MNEIYDILSEELQKALNSLQIMSREGTNEATRNRQMYIAKNCCTQALSSLRTIQGNKFRDYYKKPLDLDT